MQKTKKCGKTGVMRVFIGNKEFIKEMAKKCDMTIPQFINEIVEYYRTGQKSAQGNIDGFFKNLVQKHKEIMGIIKKIYYNTAPHEEQIRYITDELMIYWLSKVTAAGFKTPTANETGFKKNLLEIAVKIALNELRYYVILSGWLQVLLDFCGGKSYLQFI